MVEEQRVRERRLLQKQPVIQLGDVGRPCRPLCTQADEDIWYLGQHILTLGQNQVQARAAGINNQSARGRHTPRFVDRPPRVIVPEGGILDGLLNLVW